MKQKTGSNSRYRSLGTSSDSAQSINSLESNAELVPTRDNAAHHFTVQRHGAHRRRCCLGTVARRASSRSIAAKHEVDGDLNRFVRELSALSDQHRHGHVAEGVALRQKPLEEHARVTRCIVRL